MLMDSLNREKLHPPICDALLQNKLISWVQNCNASEFVSCCAFYGIQTSTDELTQYKKEAILLPLSLKSFKQDRYSSDQIFALEAIQKSKVIPLHEMAVDVSREAWIEHQKKLRLLYTQKQEGLVEEIEKRYRGLELIYGIFEIKQQEKIFLTASLETLKEIEKGKYKKIKRNSVLEWSELDFPDIYENFRKKFKTNDEEILSFARHFAHMGFSQDPLIKNWLPLYPILRNQVAEKETGILRYVYKCYQLAEGFIFMLQCLDRNNPGMVDLYQNRNLWTQIMGFKKQVLCSECGRVVKVQKKSGKPQKTCGKTDCKEALRKKNQNLSRKTIKK